MWENLKHHKDTMGETYLKEHMESLIQSASPRLYQTFWAKMSQCEVKATKRAARFRRKPRLVDKIAEGIVMGLSGPPPSFAKMGAFLAKQAFKGIKDNVRHYQK